MNTRSAQNPRAKNSLVPASSAWISRSPDRPRGRAVPYRCADTQLTLKTSFQIRQRNFGVAPPSSMPGVW